MDIHIKIPTWDGAFERVNRSGKKFRLERAHPLEDVGSLPPIIYDPETRSIRSQGGRKLVVNVVEPEREHGSLQVHITGKNGYNARWDIGHGARGNEKERIQMQRAHALALYVHQRYRE